MKDKNKWDSIAKYAKEAMDGEKGSSKFSGFSKDELKEFLKWSDSSAVNRYINHDFEGVRYWEIIKQEAEAELKRRG